LSPDSPYKENQVMSLIHQKRKKEEVMLLSYKALSLNPHIKDHNTV